MGGNADEHVFFIVSLSINDDIGLVLELCDSVFRLISPDRSVGRELLNRAGAAKVSLG